MFSFSPHLLRGHEVEAAVDAPSLFRGDGSNAAAGPRSRAEAEHSHVAIEVAGSATDAIDRETGARRKSMGSVSRNNGATRSYLPFLICRSTGGREGAHDIHGNLRTASRKCID